MNFKTLDLAWFVDRLNRRDQFTFVRYGDGEFQCIFGSKGANCDGIPYTRDLGDALRKTLLEPLGYIYAIGPTARKRTTIGKQVEKWCARFARKVDWHDTEVLLTASLEGNLRPFVEALRARRVMIVGPAHLARLAIPPASFVEVPLLDAWNARARIERDVIAHADMANVFLFSAGMAAKVIIHSLYPKFGKTHTMIDCGSLWDMYCGVESRRYARRMSIEEKAQLAERNGL